jgi:uncharacterized lipoprotein NlpE involved in copper resistance
MKKTIICAALLSFILVGCNDDSPLDNTESPEEIVNTETGEGTGEEANIDHTALMTANLNGVQYNDLAPNGYIAFNEAISMGTDLDGYNLIRIQGNSTPGNIVGNGVEINLHLREDNWAEGTYDLYEDSTDGGSMLNYIDLSSSNYMAFFESGTVTITNFDLTNRLVEGTFEFQYYHINTTYEGPYSCTSGTFKYALDDEYFD